MSGLAAMITAIGNWGNEAVRGSNGSRARQCDRAAAFLQDETPTTYIDERQLRRVTAAAANRLQRCLRETR